MQSFVLLSVDTETTGLSVRKDEVTQIAVAAQRIIVDKGIVAPGSEPLDAFCSYIRCQKSCSEQSTKITGISDAMLKTAPPPAEVYDRFLKHVDKICRPDDIRVFVAYNGISFDLPIMMAAIHRCLGKEQSALWWRRMKLSYVVDPLHMARAVLDKSQMVRSLRAGQTRCSYKLGALDLAKRGWVSQQVKEE